MQLRPANCWAGGLDVWYHRCLILHRAPCTAPHAAAHQSDATCQALWEESLLELAQCYLDSIHYEECIEACMRLLDVTGEVASLPRRAHHAGEQLCRRMCQARACLPLTCAGATLI